MAPGLRVGFGSAVITPPTPVSLAGFGEPQLATEVHDDLEARTVVFDGDGGTLCLVVCDLLGMSYGFGQPVRAAVAEALQLDEAAVLVACTHTHSGPSVMEGTAALGWHTPEGYKEQLVAGCVESARAAHAALAAATLAWTRKPLPDGLSLNRRGHPYDPYFSVLDVMGDDGRRLGALANLAVHPVALGPECLAVSADWVAPFRAAVERELGGTTVMLSAALGDVNPRHVHRQGNDCTNDGFAEAARIGEGLAEGTVTAIADVEPVGEGLGVVARRQLEVPIGGTGLAAARRSPTMPVELVEWHLGAIRVVSIPGEGFHQLGREIEASRDHKVVLAGLSPLWLGYLPVPFVEGGYEESVSYGPDAVAAVRAALLEVPDGPPAARRAPTSE